MKKIAAITMARNDEFFLNRWIAYYGRELGEENLYIYLDGLDQKTPALAGRANIKRLEHQDLSRITGDKHRIALLSNLAADLFAQGYDIVIGCDADEFLIVDPDTKKSLRAYLSGIGNLSSVSGLGMDVGQDLKSEPTLDKNKPFLEQRSYALLSTRYTKPVVLFGPLRWGSGFHSVKGHNFHIDPNLYLLHFGMVDYQMIQSKAAGRNKSWKMHLARQIARTMGVITKSKNRGESNIGLARRLQTRIRPVYALNKPAQFGLKPVAKIPERFKKIKI